MFESRATTQPQSSPCATVFHCSEKEQREAWTKYVSLTVVIIAVIAAIATQWGGKYSGRTQMSQAQA
jgi:hypothetical protein